MDILERIVKLRDERGWSNYKLAKEANIPQSTLTNLFKHSNLPTISTLESMCSAFGITIGNFFTNIAPFLTSEQNNLLNDWALLSTTQKEIVKSVINGLLQKKV